MTHSKITGNMIGHRIKEARDEAVRDQADIAADLSYMLDIDYSGQIVSRMELKTRKISDIEVYALSKILEKPIGWFFE